MTAPKKKREKIMEANVAFAVCLDTAVLPVSS
jgi:hypothetical protein